MTRGTEFSARFSRPIGVGLVLAATVSIATLYAAAGTERRELEMAISPFGWNRVIVVHSLSTLIFAWWLARTLGAWAPRSTNRSMAVVWIAAGLAIGWLTVVAGTPAEAILLQSQAGGVVRFSCRFLWCTALELPWCMAGLAATRKREASRPAIFSPLHLLTLAVVTAIGVPISFLAVFIEQQARYAQTAWQSGKLIEARQLVQRLCDVGSTVSLGDRTLPDGARVEVNASQALSDLHKGVHFVEQQIEQLMSVEPTNQRRQQLALCLLALNRDSEADSVLDAIADREAVAALLLAQVHQSKGRLTACRQWAERAIELAEQAQPSSPQDTEARIEVQLRALDLLAVAAGEQADFTAAERYLWEAVKRLPSRRAETYYRLGKHYEFVGELSKAIECQRRAASLDSDKYAAPASLVEKMLASGAPIGLARPRSSRYR
jgi:tetratricopeptide (TPR) repeat protein